MEGNTMTTVKKFTSDSKLQEYLASNKQYEVLSRIGVNGAIVLLVDAYQYETTKVQPVDQYIADEHYEHTNIHYRAYYGDY
tara:strand:- start:583 stop:825 length:243 start_codon:yes stop_codon:yes gene_type:complete